MSSNAGEVVRFTLPAKVPRCEIMADTPPFQEGDVVLFEFETRLSESVPLKEDWQVIAQLKNSGNGVPPLSLAVQQWGDSFAITGGWSHPVIPQGYQTLVGPVSREWTRWQILVSFSVRADVASISVARDGVQVLGRYQPLTGTLYPGQFNYLKYGYYRSDSIDVAAEIEHRRWRVSWLRLDMSTTNQTIHPLDRQRQIPDGSIGR